MKKFYKRLGVMIDMSRNSVMSVPMLKKYMTLLKKMGYNSLMLYTEDTYEVENEPFFGYMRGRYTKAELRDMAEYCDSIGIQYMSAPFDIPSVKFLASLKLPVTCVQV